MVHLFQATLSGMIWYVIPMSVITINDISAYMVGFFCGKTQLIKVRAFINDVTQGGKVW